MILNVSFKTSSWKCKIHVSKSETPLFKMHCKVECTKAHFEYDTDQGPLQKVFLPNTAIDLQIPILRRLVSISSSIGWVFCISLKWSNIQRNWECSQKRSLKASIERTVSVNNESGVSKGIQRNGIFLQNLIFF